MTKSTLLPVLFLLISCSVFSQIGGDNTYEFLNLTTSARIASLGGNQIAVKDNDPFLGFENPALLNSTMNNKLSLTYINYLSDISVGFGSYTKEVKDLGTFNAGIKYIDYGSFTETDEAGNEIGSFNAGEYAFVLGYGRELDTNFSVGANLKTIYSSFFDNNSVGLATDLGITYQNKKRDLTMAVLIKNAGSQLTRYNNEQSESLPFEIQYAITERLKNVPLRLGLVFQHLQQWDLQYDNPNDEASSNILGQDNTNQEEDEKGFFDNLGRHIIVNAEFLISENFNIRAGYNYLRRAELKIDEKLGTVGFSWGFGMRINKFHFSYGRAAYHQAGATNTFSVSTRLSDFKN